MITKPQPTMATVLVDTGVKIGSAWNGKHQGYVHVRDGVYWEAMYMAGPEERRVQQALLDKSCPDTRVRLQDDCFKRRYETIGRWVERTTQ